MKTHAETHMGIVRAENQDCFYSSEMPVGKLPNLFVVADGMGGHVGGKCASHTAMQAAIEYINGATEEQPAQLLREAIRVANSAVYKEALVQNLEGMGTTFVAATFVGQHLIVANVGDSRLYIDTPSTLKQITEDHSLVEEMVRMGKIEPEEARNHEKKNVITRAVGVSEEVKVDVFETELQEESQVLLCSDGLTNMVDDEQIHLILNKQKDVIEKVDKLIETANKNGGKDNITVVVIEP